MYSEKRNVRQLLSLLKAHNISRFVVSPGSRHIPIVISMEADPFFQLYSVVDERSASFFAIGLMQRFKEPIGVICTSGTASANYCSAINECLYQELPLLVLTADREECLRDQREDQMIRQSTMFQPIAKFVANLPLVKDEKDAWFNNRLINEALLELTHRGCGPVQINIPIPEHTDAFNIQELPTERVITRFDLSNINWQTTANYLEDKKIVVVCGEGFTFTEEERISLETFCNKFDAVVLCDKMSNCHVVNSIENTFPVLKALNNADISELAPDIVISIRANYSFNPEFKVFMNRALNHKCENWCIHPSGRIYDPFKGLLTNVYEMNEFTFFKQVANATNKCKEVSYAEIWKVISKSIEEPQGGFAHVNTVGTLLKQLPKGSILQLANSNSVRLAQLYHIDSSIEIHCNRGTDGIDGCMSTMVGFASATEKPVFLMIGDLTFFYDMNALWNRHIGKNIRIFLQNNGGGAIMHMPKRPDFAAEHLPNYISAHHDTSAKGWAEDRGFKYFCAHTQKELEEGVKKLTDLSIEGPIILEVFTNMLEDTHFFKGYYATINRVKLENNLKNRTRQVILSVMNIMGIDKDDIKKTLKKYSYSKQG